MYPVIPKGFVLGRRGAAASNWLSLHVHTLARARLFSAGLQLSLYSQAGPNSAENSALSTRYRLTSQHR